MLNLIMRFFLFAYYYYHPQQEKCVLFLLVCTICLTAALWGLMGSWLMPKDNMLDQMIIIILLAGLTSGVPHVLQGNLFASMASISLMLIPLTIWSFLQIPYAYHVLGVAIAGYTIAILTLAYHNNKLLEKNLRLKLVNSELTSHLLQVNSYLQDSETRFHSFFNCAAIGMAITTVEGHFLKVNQVLCDMTGYDEKELCLINFKMITFPEDLNENLSLLKMLLDEKVNSFQMRKRYIRKDGKLIWVLLNVSLDKDENNQALYLIEQIQNIDDLVKAEKQLISLAYHDPLTGLANRKMLDVSFEIALKYIERHKESMAIFYIDLDRFNTINDTFGHEVGDMLLKVIGQRLLSITRKTDIAARLGGDEMVLVLTEVFRMDDIVTLAKRIQQIIAERMIIKGAVIHITASIGISVYPHDGIGLEELLRKADHALYRVKDKGRNDFLFYDAQPS